MDEEKKMSKEDREDFRKRLGDRLYRLMLEQDISLKEVAYAAGRGINTIQRVRHTSYGGHKGYVSLKTLVKIETVISQPPFVVKMDTNG